jgi:SAM-dependent methyltransferase
MSAAPSRPTDATLPPREAAAFDAWLAATVARYVPPLVFAEVRKGVQALSSLYVERRREGRLGSRATDGEGKRAALASFYAPLHLLVAHAAARAFLAPPNGTTPRRIVDLGCGTGAAGAGVALAFARPPAVLAIDASGWALGEAQRTHRAFGLTGRMRRGTLPEALPRALPGDCLVLGWFLNELGDAPRETLLAAIEASCARGASLLLLEPLARGVAPWWDAAARRLSRAGVTSHEVKIAPERPDWIERLDDAAGLDHREVGARVLCRPEESR